MELQMQTKPKSNSTITSTIIEGRVEFTVLNAGKIVFDPNKVSAENRARAMMHGFVQRISDGGALSRNPDTGLPATPADKLARMQRIADHLMSGATEWALKVAAARDDTGLVLMALMRVRKIDIDGANALIERMMAKAELDRKAVLANVAKNPDIVRAIGDIRAERAAETTLAVDLLGEMDDEEG